ncbi:hypothetical protein QDX81_03785 [Pseudomonas sp. CW003PS]|nr:hypothetical protein [Pseudomonas sp. s4]WGL64102.1 hypothetical protein QDX81_03785 [Pseudomonas sp. CW003PS]
MLRLGRGDVGVQSLVEQRALFGIDLNKVSMKPAAAHCSLLLPSFSRRSWAISNESFVVGADMGEEHPSITPQDGSHLDTEVIPLRVGPRCSEGFFAALCFSNEAKTCFGEMPCLEGDLPFTLADDSADVFGGFSAEVEDTVLWMFPGLAMIDTVPALCTNQQKGSKQSETKSP